MTRPGKRSTAKAGMEPRSAAPWAGTLPLGQRGDPKVLDVPPPTNNDSYPTQKKGKSAGEDNIPLEVVQAGGEAMIDMLLITCNKISRTE